MSQDFMTFLASTMWWIGKSESSIPGEEVTAGCKDDTEKVQWIFEWVHDEIKHIHDRSQNPVTCVASKVAVGPYEVESPLWNKG
jgi:hypothetical protein